MRDRPVSDLFLVSWLLLFLELACIRWFPAHVLFLTFFTNTVLLACFVGMSVGLLIARRPGREIVRTPVWLALALVESPDAICTRWFGTMAGPVRGVPVQTAYANPRQTRKMPRVATSFSDVDARARSRGRKTNRSSTRPMPGPTTSNASGAATINVTCHWAFSCQST